MSQLFDFIYQRLNKFALINLFITTICLAPALSNFNTINTGAVEGLPTAGPNCYFTALTVNNLLNVPASTISDSMATVLFLNPSLCRTVEHIQYGDIGLEMNMGIISHVFTVINSNVRYEKPGSSNEDRYGYANKPISTADIFVRCSNMQGWIDRSIKSTTSNLQELHSQINKLEEIIDLRNGLKSDAKRVALADGIEALGGYDKLIRELQKQLQIELAEFGVKFVPYPGMLNGEYLKFAKSHTILLSNPKIFTLLWISARLQMLSETSIYYNFEPN